VIEKEIFCQKYMELRERSLRTVLFYKQLLINLFKYCQFIRYSAHQLMVTSAGNYNIAFQI